MAHDYRCFEFLIGPPYQQFAVLDLAGPVRGVEGTEIDPIRSDVGFLVWGRDTLVL